MLIMEWKTNKRTGKKFPSIEKKAISRKVPTENNYMALSIRPAERELIVK